MKLLEESYSLVLSLTLFQEIRNIISPCLWGTLGWGSPITAFGGWLTKILPKLYPENGREVKSCGLRLRH